MRTDYERLDNARDIIFQDMLRKQFGSNGLTIVTNMSLICLLLFIMFIMLLFGVTYYKDLQYENVTKSTKTPMLVIPPNIEKN